MAEGRFAQERAARHRLADRRQAPVVVRGRDPVEGGRVDRLVGGIVGDLIDERSKPREGACEGPRRQLDPRLAVRPEMLDPGHDRRDRVRQERFTGWIELSFGHPDHFEGSALVVGLVRSAGQPRLGEEAADVVEDDAAVVGLRRETIDDDDERQAALADAT